MKEITILSGKGGTGKTTITAALASVAEKCVFCDSDVDAADLHLILQPEIREENIFYSAWLPKIDHDKCTNCGTCVDYCRFDAIHSNENGDLTINPFQCEGCRLCERLCPSDAICSERSSNNRWFVSETRFGTLVHAKMGPGEENSGKLVTQVRKRAKEIAQENKLDYIISDGPPGIGCATISSLSGANLVLIVMEPTKSGLHDAERLIELIQSFNISAFAIINKYDMNTDVSDKIQKYLKTKHIRLLTKIPFDKEMVEAMIEGKTIVEYNPDSIISEKVNEVWQTMKE